ncbi:hypothetical protein A4E84_24470 [Streptomyces qaidamensis]|uniref:DUF4190 domain-containing protein n=1 Tax=Streptomyces qaidamensis TaxID=1783515 RepID=A0A143C4G6_9ACTN|nr:hypothetical protein [Streptomyces qaidamensis]AMW12367.1 hypothetical protein A4E84_24470 [Streptomyces qaidamensis]
MTSSAAPGEKDSPATALGPTALVLGVFSALGTWALLFPWTVLAGALAVTFGAMGLHYARRGTGRVWSAAAGMTLGATGFIGTITLLWGLA